jgi:hypothetical protein
MHGVDIHLPWIGRYEDTFSHGSFLLRGNIEEALSSEQVQMSPVIGLWQTIQK